MEFELSLTPEIYEGLLAILLASMEREGCIMVSRSGKKPQDLAHAREHACQNTRWQLLAAGIALFLCGAHSAWAADATDNVAEEHFSAERQNWALQVTPYV